MALSTGTEISAKPSVSACYPKARQGWYALGVLTFVYVFAFIDRQILTLLVGPIRRDLGISDTEVSLLTGFGFVLFYTAFGLPLARLADSGSRRALVGCGFAMWSLFCAGCGLARNYTQLLLMRIGVGIGEASLAPAAYSLITDYFPASRRPLAQGFFNAGISIGAGLAYVLGGAVIGFSDSQTEWVLPLTGPIRSWQFVFLIVGLPGVVFSLLLATIREPVRQGPGAHAKSVSLQELFDFIKQNRTTLICHSLGSSMLFFSTYGAAAWVPTFFIRHFHWTAGQIGAVYGINAAVFATAGIIFGGWFAGYLTKRGYQDACMRVALIGSILWFPSGIAFLIVPNAMLSAVLLAPTGFFAIWLLSVAPAALMEITPARMRGQIGSIYVFVGNLIGLGLGPTAVALITDYVFHDDTMVGYSLLIVTVLAHVAAVAFFWTGLKPFVRSKERFKALSDAEAA